MATVTPSSISNISLTPRISSITEKNNLLTRCTFSRKNNKRALPAQKYIIPPLSTSLRLFPQFRFGCNVQPKQRYNIVSATGTDVAVEEADLPATSNEATDTTSEATAESSSSKPETNPTQVKRSRPSRKSEMPPVKNEELVPGATFTGKVRSVQPFGAFVDFGAFTDGLVHVSQLSDSFVKDVASFVTVGQEVKVRLVEANMETGRISLTMRKSDDASSGDKNNKSRPPRKSGQQKFNQKNDMNKKSTNLVRGQERDGTVKNITRSGAFISLPEGEEGFLPQSEEADEGFVSMMGGSSLEIGQEVSVKVLRINRGQVTLTMKKDEDAGDLESKLNQGVVHTATNPFVLAFRSNKEISAFLDERKNEEELSPVSSQIADVEASSAVVTGDVSLSTKEQVTEEVPASTQAEAESESEENEDVADAISKDEEQSQEPSSVENKDLSELSTEDMEEQVTEEVPASTQAEAEENKDVADAISKDEEQSQEPSLVENKDLSELSTEDMEEQVTEEVPASTEAEAEAEAVAEAEAEENKDVADAILKDEEQSQEPSSVENKDLSELSTEEVPAPSEVGAVAEEGKVSEEPSSVENKVLSELSGEITEDTTDVVNEPIEKSDETIATASQGEEEIAEQNLEENGGIESSNLKADSPENEVAGETSESEVLAQASSGEGGNTNGSSDSLEKENTAKAAISPSLVKQLRDETGAGMMDCKKALSETGGDLEKAQEYLRKKGLASADKKSSRVTAEGRIGSYIHDSRIGILVEVNCETDFVARGDIFKELVEDLAMQAAACPQVKYLNTEDVPKEIVEKEREIEMQKEDLLSKPEQIRSKIVDGRIRKRLEELALLEQPFIKDDKVLVKDWVKQTISTVGENIKVKRFERYNLGEGLEKKSQDFAAEVAAQTAAKAAPTPVRQETEAASETTEITEKPQTVAVSAALVKQLREETGAGMMDCKKALSETGGDLEKAQEYLRKKGLSTADKKSSRLAAEGRIGSYIHDSRIGVLIEVNCETDFVARGQNFKELVDDLAMQVVACPQVQYVSIEDIPESIVSKEKQLEMQREDLQSKPENIREKIVEGRITKRLGELSLLEQPFIKDDSMLVKDLVKQTVAALGENIKVRRFVRYTLGETTSEAQVEDSEA